MAEYYGITDIKGLPVETLATLSYGLPSDSRVLRKISGQKLPMNTMLLAAIVDKLAVLIWQNSENGRKGKNKPVSILSELLTEKQENDLKVYKSGQEFDAARKKLLKGVKK